jgi:thymidylate synthase (FAD)
MSKGDPPTEAYARPAVHEMDGVLGQRFQVLDDGFVRPVDYMGSDASIVQAARVSYGSGTKRIGEDRALIRYLMRHGHTTPFEMCELKLHVRVPMDTWRQWIRHRTASVNEYSTRYSIAIDNAQSTPGESWRRQSLANRQGSSDFLEPKIGAVLSSRESELQQLARDIYSERLTAGVAREQARKDLPLSTYTEAYWKINLHNLLHFLKLRLDPHAQLEIRQYASVIGDRIVRLWCPLTWEAFVDYQLQGVTLSKLEAHVLSLIAQGRRDEAISQLHKSALLKPSPKGGWQPSRERQELEAKLAQLGIDVPWLAAE